MKRIGTVVTLIVWVNSLAWGEEKGNSKIDVIGKTHTISTFNSFSGAGTQMPGLANTYDMSIYEFNLGGKQSTFNGSGITTNSNYPLTNGWAITNNTHVGVSSQPLKDMRVGFTLELYTLQGDKTVGRVFGEELPWNDFPRNNAGTIHPARFHFDHYNAFLEGSHEMFSYKFVGGSLSPRELPELTRKEMNQVKLGSLVYRAPVTNASFFEKEDRKIEEGRHPLKGFDFIGNYHYADDKNIHVELFSGATKPTPLSDIERDAFGGRAAVDLGAGNVGVTYVYNNGLRHNSNVEENQGVWAIDSSYKLFDWFVPYLTFAQTDYERETTAESHTANAYVAGALIKFLHQYELKAQYQRLEENYDLMAYHKTEHYPGNTHGPSVQLTAALTNSLKAKGTVSHLRQFETATTSDDTLFGDSFFPSNKGADQGTIDVQRGSAEYKMNDRWMVSGYIEHAKFYQEALNISSSIDKDVYNFYGGTVFNLTNRWALEGGIRHFLSKGDWQSMPFDSYQDIPEAAIRYQIDKETRAMLLYHYYNFADENVVAQGNNDYHGHQIILEAKVPF